MIGGDQAAAGAAAPPAPAPPCSVKSRVPSAVPDAEHGDQEAEVADPVHDERLLAGVGVHLVLNQKPISR